MSIRKQVRTFAGLTTNVDAQTMLMISQDDIATQIRDIKARLAVLETAAGQNRRQLAHNPAVYSPNVQPSAPMV